MMKKKRIIIVLAALVCLFIKPQLCADILYFNIVGYQLGRNILDAGKFALTDSYYRLGIGTTIFSSFLPRNTCGCEGLSVYGKSWGIGNAKLRLAVIMPLEIYIVPFTWEKPSVLENYLGNIHFYGIYSFWVHPYGNIIEDEDPLYRNDEKVYAKTTWGGQYSDTGIGISVSPAVTLKIGYQKIYVPEFKLDIYRKSDDAREVFLVDKYSEERWSIGLDIYIGGWRDTEEGAYDHVSGFLPWAISRKK